LTAFKLEGKIRSDDVKTKSQILKELLNNFVAEEGIELKLRKKVKDEE
jgi:hypothetical protein